MLVDLGDGRCRLVFVSDGSLPASVDCDFEGLLLCVSVWCSICEFYLCVQCYIF